MFLLGGARKSRKGISAKVYTTEVVVENQEFTGSQGQKNSADGTPEAPGMPDAAPGGWADIPDDMGDLPFN